MNPSNLTINELEKIIISANAAYAQGMPYMTDYDYDQYWKALFHLDPDNSLLYHTGENHRLPFNELSHKYQIMGTQKAFNMEDLKPYLARFGSQLLRLEPKYDGCAAVHYIGKDESNDTLILEGNGISGRDISHHVPYLFGTYEPRPVESIELIIPWKNWDPDYGKNPRNTVAGWIARQDISEFHHIIEMVSHTHGDLTATYRYDGNEDKLYEKLLSCYKKWSELYPLDGIMIKLDDEQQRLIANHNGTVYNWSIAWKPPIQTKSTTVFDIEWNVSRSGRIIPTVCYDPIELCQTTNSRVTGNNAKWIIEHNIAVGNTITVGKAGEIIPKILDSDGANRPDILIHCPVCHSTLTWSGVDLICSSDNCIAQLTKSIAYFYSDKGMDVKTIGEKRIYELLKNKTFRDLLIKNPWALLDPIAFKIYDLIQIIWGNKHTQNYMSSLSEIKGKKTPIHFIAALGYPKLAHRTALKIFNFVTHKVPFKSVSQEAQRNFIKAYAAYQQALNQFNSFKFAPAPLPATKTYTITGTLSAARNDFINYLSSKGWQFANQVSKSTDYLIVGDLGHKTHTTKLLKAKEFNTKIITEEELDKILKP